MKQFLIMFLILFFHWLSDFELMFLLMSRVASETLILNLGFGLIVIALARIEVKCWSNSSLMFLWMLLNLGRPGWPPTCSELCCRFKVCFQVWYLGLGWPMNWNVRSPNVRADSLSLAFVKRLLVSVPVSLISVPIV